MTLRPAKKSASDLEVFPASSPDFRLRRKQAVNLCQDSGLSLGSTPPRLPSLPMFSEGNSPGPLVTQQVSTHFGRHSQAPPVKAFPNTPSCPLSPWLWFSGVPLTKEHINLFSSLSVHTNEKGF